MRSVRSAMKANWPSVWSSVKTVAAAGNTNALEPDGAESAAKAIGVPHGAGLSVYNAEDAVESRAAPLSPERTRCSKGSDGILRAQEKQLVVFPAVRNSPAPSAKRWCQGAVAPRRGGAKGRWRSGPPQAGPVALLLGPPPPGVTARLPIPWNGCLSRINARTPARSGCGGTPPPASGG